MQNRRIVTNNETRNIGATRVNQPKSLKTVETQTVLSVPDIETELGTIKTFCKRQCKKLWT